MRTLHTVGLILAVVACRIQTTNAPATGLAYFTGCWSLSYGEGSGTWDGPLPRRLSLTSESVAADTAWRRGSTTYDFTPPGVDTVVSPHPIWRVVGSDSVEVAFSGRESRWQLLMRARGQFERLSGTLGIVPVGRPFIAYVRVSGTRTPCP